MIGVQLAKDGFITLGIRIANTVLALILGVMTARVLGPAGRGIYVLPSVDAAIVVSLLAGLMTATSYFMLNKQAGKGVLPVVARVAALFCAIGIIPICVIAAVGHALWAALPAIIVLPLTATMNITTGYAYGIKKVRYANAISLGTTLLTLILMFFGLYFIAREATVAIVVWLVANAMIAIFAIVMLLRHARHQPAREVSFREYLQFAGKAGLANVMTLLDYRIDVYVVATLAAAGALGLYTIAVSGAESVFVVTQVASIVTAPHIGSLSRPAAAELTARAMRANLFLALVIAAILYVVAMPLIVLLYGPAFADAASAFRILLPGVVVLSTASIISSYFTLQLGKPGLLLYISASSAALCCAISILLVPRIGIMGAAIGTSVAYILAHAWGLIVFYRSSGIPIRALLFPNVEDMNSYVRIVRRLCYGE